MKNKLTTGVIAAMMALCLFGKAEFDYALGERSTDTISPQTEAAALAILGDDGAKLIHALKLQMSKYDSDMKTESGRRAYHGKFICEEVFPDEFVKVMTYSNEVNGAVWRIKVPFNAPPQRTLAMRGRKVSIPTNGVPRVLAAARKRRENEINNGPVYTNIVINASGAKPEAQGESTSEDPYHDFN